MNMFDVLDRMQAEIFSHEYIFDYKERDIMKLKEMLIPENIPIYKEMLIKAFKNMFFENPRVLILEMLSSKHKEEQNNDILNNQNFDRILIENIDKEDENGNPINVIDIIKEELSRSNHTNASEIEDSMNEFYNAMYYEDIFKKRWINNHKMANK